MSKLEITDFFFWWANVDYQDLWYPSPPSSFYSTTYILLSILDLSIVTLPLLYYYNSYVTSQGPTWNFKTSDDVYIPVVSPNSLRLDTDVFLHWIKYLIKYPQTSFTFLLRVNTTVFSLRYVMVKWFSSFTK